MNTGEMLERVYQEVGHKDRYYIVSLLNEALSLLVWGAGGIDKTAYLSFIDGQAIAPTDLISPIMLTGELIDPFTQDSFTTYNEGGRGNKFALFDGVLYLYPVQDAELTLHYYGGVEALTDDADVPTIEAAWHHLLPMYASAMASDQKGDIRMQRFETGRATYNVSMIRKRKRSRVREVMDW